MSRRALVTGAARGVGAAIAERLRADGLEVVTLDRDPGCDVTLDLAGDSMPDFGVVRACLPGMRERNHGRIVVISSGAATDGLPGQVAYSASKAGLIGMVKTLAAENVARGITANAVLPGLVATEKVLAMPAEVLERARAMVPSGRLAEPSEVADLVAFLGSEQAGSVTGQTIGIDGGYGLSTQTLGSERA